MSPLASLLDLGHIDGLDADSAEQVLYDVHDNLVREGRVTQAEQIVLREARHSFDVWLDEESDTKEEMMFKTTSCSGK
jgi:hypothetical protein